MLTLYNSEENGYYYTTVPSCWLCLCHSRFFRTSRLDHSVFSKGQWRRSRFMDHPKVQLELSVLPSDYHHFRRKCPSVSPTTIMALADSGAQSCLWSLQEFLAAGFTTKDLIPMSIDLVAANKSPISIEGGIIVRLHATASDGNEHTCATMVYISKQAHGFYLSMETMIDLAIISRDFPNVGASTTPAAQCTAPQNAIQRTINAGCSTPSDDPGHACSCPPRTMVPELPKELPFECKPENNARMKEWLLTHFASSTFNTCPHRPLPHMTGPPVEIHIKPDAVPKAVHTPATIPIHWQKQVQEDLHRDEALGVIEKVPYGQPVTWCHRMVVTRKHDGTPRRTVDLSPLNKHCRRETFASESPFHLARRIPPDTWKTVSDAWNGFHSVPLRESDRHLTTFITPFGRWRYRTTPQGFVGSGDGYNRRFDAILSDFERKERVTDDTIHYDTDLQDHWWRTIQYLIRIGQSGIVLNPDKFQFACKTVDFAGFRISDTFIEPLPKYIDAIRNFPIPKSTTDIRSWFGLVNQVSNYAQLREIMSPFKPFLSPKCSFQWTPELDAAFNLSKEIIIEAICHGVEIFDPSKRTCLRPDWSRQGIGYFLLQKHCACDSTLPSCCTTGWKIVLAGSRFLSSTEQRYAPIEGECLAVAWGLEQTKYFTQDCTDLLVVTDHKPLVKILGDRTLDEISNTRIFRLKQRTLPWCFEIAHLPGQTNAAADATSRYPSAAYESFQEPDDAEHVMAAAIRHDTHNIINISWETLAIETSKDSTMHQLRKAIEDGFQNAHRTANIKVSQFWPYRESLHVLDDVILYHDRVVIPTSLRSRVLQILHSAHQGVSAMESRARAIIFWPGMTKDIQSLRDNCMPCNRNAPSQVATPSILATIPSTPFESIFADFFDFGGCHYLLAGDRLSGWVEVFKAPYSTALSGAKGLISAFRTLFATFGVPEELSSDGGPEFGATATAMFLKNWGVRHRISSAYFPQSNGRAEVAVKKCKRLLMDNIKPNGSLDNDAFLRALLQIRNTPDPDCNISPAEVVFGRPIRDAFSFVNRQAKFTNPSVRPSWREAWEKREEAMRVRFSRTSELLNAHAHRLPPLVIGDRVFVQNQHGQHPKKWDKSGIVMELGDHDQYVVKVDGSGRLTLRNRRFLRRFTPPTTTITQSPENLPSTLVPEPDAADQPFMSNADDPILTTSEPTNQQNPAAVPDLQLLHPGDQPNETPHTIPVPPVNEPIRIHEPTLPSSPPLHDHMVHELDELPLAHSRPQRHVRAPPMYIPESGTWEQNKR